MIEELECALGALDAYWWLTLEEGEIKPASYPQTFANYVLSFFTDAHQRALKERFVDVLREVDHTTAKAQIVLEKMKKLYQCQKRQYHLHLADTFYRFWDHNQKPHSPLRKSRMAFQKNY